MHGSRQARTRDRDARHSHLLALVVDPGYGHLPCRQALGCRDGAEAIHQLQVLQASMAVKLRGCDRTQRRGCRESMLLQGLQGCVLAADCQILADAR